MDDKEPAKDKEEAQKALQNEMRDFRKYVLNRLKKKSRGKRKFETTVIPSTIRDTIYARLEKTDKIDEVGEIFDQALFEIKMSMAKETAEEEIQAVFDDIQQEIIDNLETLDEEDMETSGSAKKYLLLLLLLGDLDYRGRIDDVMRRTLKYYGNIALELASDEIKRLGGKVTRSQKRRIVDDYINERMDFLNKELNRVTEERLGNMFAEAETAADIEKGLVTNYALSEGRAKIIANNEYHELQNTVLVRVAKETDEVAAMFITDGILYDSPCIEANGSLWSVEYAETHPLQHINCQRILHPVGKEFVEQYGGLDEK
jgi:hypothetical protein